MSRSQSYQLPNVLKTLDFFFSVSLAFRFHFGLCFGQGFDVTWVYTHHPWSLNAFRKDIRMTGLNLAKYNNIDVILLNWHKQLRIEILQWILFCKIKNTYHCLPLWPSYWVWSVQPIKIQTENTIFINVLNLIATTVHWMTSVPLLCTIVRSSF